jgi:hypothetical protein
MRLPWPFFGVLMVAGCAASLPARSWSGWSTVESEGFVVHAHDGDPPPWALESLASAHAVMRATFFAETPSPRLEVLWAPRDNAVTETYQLGSATYVVAPRSGAAPPRVLTVFGEVYDKLGERPDDAPQVTPETVTEREIVHQVAQAFILSALPRAPIWFREAWAEYLQDVAVGKEGDHWVAVFDAWRWRDRYRTFQGITRRIVGEPELPPWRDRALGRLFVRFLIQGDGGIYRARFVAFANALAGGAPAEEALATVYPDLPPGTLRARVLEQEAEIVTSAFVLPLPRDPRDQLTVRRGPMPAAEVRLLVEDVTRARAVRPAR